MNRTVGLISAAGIGAGFMYLFDPDRGRRRMGRGNYGVGVQQDSGLEEPAGRNNPAGGCYAFHLQSGWQHSS